MTRDASIRNTRRLLSLILPPDEANLIVEELLDAAEPRRAREEHEREAARATCILCSSFAPATPARLCLLCEAEVWAARFVLTASRKAFEKRIDQAAHIPRRTWTDEGRRQNEALADLLARWPSKEDAARRLLARLIVAQGSEQTPGGGIGFRVGVCPCREWFAYSEQEIPGVLLAFVSHVAALHPDEPARAEGDPP